MEISAIVLSSGAFEAMFAPRAIPNASVSALHAGAGGPAVVASSGNGNGDRGAGIASIVDKMRADFAMFRLRVNEPSGLAVSQAPMGPNGSVTASDMSNSALAQMQQVMAWSLRTQTDVLQMAVGFHAGLSATQQSQNAVKTLVEKS
jgi:hypothetical protein